MAIDAPTFRANFPAFASTTRYPDGQVNFYLTTAYSLLNAQLFQNTIDFAAQLYTAHMLALTAVGNAESSNGAPPGLSPGPVSSKSVGELSITYAAQGLEEGSGFWNQSTYGTQLYRFMRIFGAAPLVTPPGRTPDGIGNGPAWPGPLFENFTNP